ncbi:aldehyde-activating protein [Rhizobium sp. M10]|uniref:GFA family protein n=1 Tax=Rhizobium sp. M10 TaxID=1324586 RepID=UPI000BE82BF5|nr:GFA family protein [Rhizobium sp. M10]PDT34585.1 aldehyde-activating protein [Rhizobium sp. M10]
MHKGSCLCSAVTFEIEGDLRAPDACHCSKCRKQSGHFFASADVARHQIKICGGEVVTWYHSSENVRRGFCAVCGSSLFWDPIHCDWIAVAMGALDSPTHAKLKMHIFVADKGDYYDITDDLPRNEQ